MALDGCGTGSTSTGGGTVGRGVGQSEGKRGAPACGASDLTITPARHSSIGSGGTNYTDLYVTNRSAAACTVAGVPKVVASGEDGKTIEVGEADPDLRPGSGSRRLRVTIAPGESAGFLIAHYGGIGAGRCRIVLTSGLRVTIPGTGTRAVVRPTLGYCPKPDAGLFLRVGRIE